MRYKYRLTCGFRENGQPDETPSVETYDSLAEMVPIIEAALNIFPAFDPTLFIERIKVEDAPVIYGCGGLEGMGDEADDDGAPCCYGNVTSSGQFHEPGCPSVEQGERA